MNQLKVAGTLLEDSQPEIRNRGVHILADCPDDGAETLLVEALADSCETVWVAARRVLRFRQPWLAMEPYMTRPLPEEARSSPEAKAWTALRRGISRWLARTGASPDILVLKRWIKLPGAIPDIIEALENLQFDALANRLAEQANLFGRFSNAGRQIMFCPTYACNLDCSYCYARGWNGHFRRGIALKNLAIFFSWCIDNNINHLVLGGGEPTVYPYFPILLKQAQKLNIRVSLTSNTLFSESVGVALNRKAICEFIAHYDQTLMKRPLLNRRFENNLRTVRDNGIPLFLRYTLTQDSDEEEWHRILNLADRFHIRTLNYAFAFGNILGNNTYVKYHNEQKNNRFERKFKSFFSICRDMEISLHLCKPVPFCLVGKEFLRTLLLSGSIRPACAAYLDWFSRNVTVNPDLSTLPCNAIGVLGPKITEIADVKKLGAYHKKLLQSLLFSPFFERCNGCMFYFRGFCQGVCLAEKFRYANSIDRRAYYVLPMPKTTSQTN